MSYPSPVRETDILRNNGLRSIHTVRLTTTPDINGELDEYSGLPLFFRILQAPISKEFFEDEIVISLQSLRADIGSLICGLKNEVELFHLVWPKWKSAKEEPTKPNNDFEKSVSALFRARLLKAIPLDVKQETPRRHISQRPGETILVLPSRRDPNQMLSYQTPRCPDCNEPFQLGNDQLESEQEFLERHLKMHESQDVRPPLITSIFPNKTINHGACSETTNELPGPSVPEFKKIDDLISNSQNIGLLTGIPTYKVEQMDVLIRTMLGEEWWFLVFARRFTKKQLLDTDTSLKDKFFGDQSNIYTKPMGEDGSVQLTDPFYKEYLYYLDKDLNRVKYGVDNGMWETFCFFGSPSLSGYSKLNSILKSVFAGEDSEPEPIRTTQLKVDSRPRLVDLIRSTAELRAEKHENIEGSIFSTPNFSTPLTSKEVAILLSPPHEEFPGIEVYTEPKFAVNVPKLTAPTTLDLGEVLDRGITIGNSFELEPKSFVKHSLIVGQTGYGKTTLIQYILLQLQLKCSVPWLVIEPVKNEYRKLISNVAGLRVFTVNEENVAPFRLNPLEVPPKVSVQAHITMLMSIFNMVFAMYTSLPHILESCLRNVYTWKGWGPSDLGDSNVERDFPTLGDLYTEIEKLDLAFSTETSKEHKAALQYRIMSLMQGNKGEMLNCRRSFPIQDLLSHPTVIELKELRDDDEKALIMGLLFGVISEYIEHNFPYTNQLRHLTVLEEAHRILSNVESGSRSAELGNPKAKIVGTLSDYLSEVRAHGEGIMIVNQIPTELTPRAIKNTSLKIVFHTEHSEDKQVIGDTMGLTKVQRNHLAHLKEHEAICLSETLHGAIKMNTFPELPLFSDPPSDEKVKKHMAGYFAKHSKLTDPLSNSARPFLGCSYCLQPCQHRFAIQPLTRNSEFKRKLKETLIRTTGSDYSNLKMLLNQYLSARGYRGWNPSAALCALVQSLNNEESNDRNSDLKQKLILETTKEFMDDISKPEGTS